MVDNERKKFLKEEIIEIRRKLRKLGEANGFEVKDEYSITKYRTDVKGKLGVVDVVWLMKNPYKNAGVPFLKGDLPIFAFEIESGWRTSNTLKGDIVKLGMLDCLKGFVVFTKNAFQNKKDFETAKNAVIRYCLGMGTFNNIQVLLNNDLDKLLESLNNK